MLKNLMHIPLQAARNAASEFIPPALALDSPSDLKQDVSNLAYHEMVQATGIGWSNRLKRHNCRDEGKNLASE
jgi:hypothetical protein